MRDNPEEKGQSDKAVSIEKAFKAYHELTPDGFMMFHPVRSPGGAIIDLEWTFVNPAAGRIVGRAPTDLVGKHLLVEMPGNRDDGLFDAYVGVIEKGDTWQNEFRYDHDGISAWFRTTAAKSGDGLAISFADITESRKSEEKLRDLIDGVLAFVGVLNLDGILLEANEPAVAAAGLPRDQLIGVPFWDCYWWDVGQATKDQLKEAVKTAAAGERVRYDVEIQVVGGHRLWIDFQIAPVTDETGTVVELIPSGVDITERKQSEAHRELLIRELSHRVKNSLATIQSIVGQSIRTSASMEDFRATFNARLRAISACHDLLVRFDHTDLPLIALVEGQVLPYAAEAARLVTKGEDTLLPGDIAHALGLILHELATNASKYGALSQDAGTVTVSWHIEETEGAPRLHLEWVERGGPPVTPPTRQGFGTRLIERSLSSDDNKAVLKYDPAGFSCQLQMDIE